jgi:hypothetical protein
MMPLVNHLQQLQEPVDEVEQQSTTAVAMTATSSFCSDPFTKHEYPTLYHELLSETSVIMHTVKSLMDNPKSIVYEHHHHMSIRLQLVAPLCLE